MNLDILKKTAKDQRYRESITTIGTLGKIDNGETIDEELLEKIITKIGYKEKLKDPNKDTQDNLTEDTQDNLTEDTQDLPGTIEE